jgi:hypothetical protein|tara:strand:- start:409 stop:759 length:351 start_codon:yes stop_codon:yes gene_type:complete
MKQITELTNDYKQILFPTLEDSSTFKLSVYYSLQQEQWFVDFTFKSLIIKGLRLVLSSNVLGQWENILPFGLMCISTDGAGKEVDPFLLNDFSGGRCKLYILTKEELTELDTAING